MTNNTDELAALWQTQGVQTIDIDKLRRELTGQRRKQRLYILIDLLSPVPLILMLHIMADELSSFSRTVIWGLLIITIPLVGYLLWLRRHAAFSTAVNTQAYVDVLYRQIANNVKIAKLTKHSCWVAVLYLAGILGWELVTGEKAAQPDFSSMRFYGALGLGVVFSLHCYLWGQRRERRFRARLQELALIKNQS
ncbi:hypothetical protein J3369_21410 [Alteromonas sp. NFXS44]|uniref:hypothetical protein n=1 Tax=Alteromonas sp. NFXS44 TaxID=2818435 RepID=UPI0032DFA3A2